MIARAGLTIRIRYLVAGLVLGLAWAWHAGEPPWEHVLRLVIVVLILAPILRLVPRALGVRRVWTRRVPWLRLLAYKLPLLALALLADWGLGHWMTATVSGLVAAAALAAAVAGLGPVLHSRLFAASPGAGSAVGPVGADGPARAGESAHGSSKPAGRPARPGRRRVAVRAGGAALVLIVGFLLKQFVVQGILRHDLTDSGLAAEAALVAVLAALAITAWVRRRRSAARQARALTDGHADMQPFTEEAEHAATQHLADHVRPAPSRCDGVRRRPGGADPAH